MAGKIKWGILGYANIARDELIPAILQSKNSEFYALASRAPGKLESCRKSFNFEKGYVGYDALLNDPEVQAVYIPLPNSLHREWTIKAARCGKHVLCEKPVALNAAECMEMTEACESNHVLLMEAFMYRYSDRVRQLKKLLDSGMIGEIRHISASYRFLLDWGNDVRMVPELGGGSLYDVGCYPVNFIGMITGRVPSAVQAQVVMQNGVDYSFSSLLE
ncbi:MAG: Gfo/Idh/MocA family oxidoreductase, partial [Clostridia bacterium]|nr:Gfo/Idh/MocA family oxidoreductase [Clostridia bacterium]